MTFAEAFLAITITHTLAAMSPGPDFALVSHKTVSQGRQAGILCSFGTALGLGVHITYSSLGLATLFTSDGILPRLLMVAGGTYLLYLGVSIFTTSRSTSSVDANSIPTPQKRESRHRIIAQGFLCNTLNPKAPLYFVSLFAVIVPPESTLVQLSLLGVWMILIQFTWFSYVSFFFSSEFFKQKFVRVVFWINQFMAIIFLALGSKIMISVFVSI